MYKSVLIRPLAQTLCFALFLYLPQVEAETLIIGSVNVISTLRGEVHESVDVVISDGRIEAIVPAGSYDQDRSAHVVDGACGWLIPGLAEMHAHIPSRSSGEQYARDILSLYLANGITTARGMLGEPWHLSLREALNEQTDWIGPRLITSGPSLNGRSVESPEQAGELVRQQHAAGYDFLKLHPGLKAAEFEAIANAANELNMPFGGHVSADVTLDATLRQRQATIDHLDGYAAALVPRTSPQYGEEPQFFGVNLAHSMNLQMTSALAMATALAGVWNVPTQSLLENMAGTRPVPELLLRPGMEFISENTRQSWIEAIKNLRDQAPEADRLAFLEVRRALIRELQDARAGLLLGSDAPQIMNVPGFSIHEELEFMVASGLTPLQALQSGTTNVAQFFGRQKSGDIQSGFDADLILLAANPLLSISATRSIKGVVRAGRWYGRTTLDQWLEDIHTRKL